jgi:hypothetical protein
MVFTIAWENDEQTVIRITYLQRWTWDEVREAKAKSQRMMDSVSHRVTIFLCWGNDNWMPPNYQDNVRMILENSHPNLDMMIFVRKNSLFHQFFRQFAATHPVPFQYAFATSIEDARMLLPTETG